MSEIKVNKISPRTNCGTVTLGDSGDTIALGAGASQTGFGSTGGISWQTSIKTTDFTAVSNEGYFVNTSGGSNITVTLPASPSAGNVVAIKDYARTFGTNKVIVARNGSNMDGAAENTDLDTDGLSVTFVFMDSTKGWSLINDDITNQIGAKFISATGGNTVATCGNFKIHTFTSPGTFCVSCAGNAGGSNTVSYVVIAGGGGGGAVVASNIGGGGGGAGGYREGLGLNDSYTGSPLRAPTGVPVTATGFPITVGAGGAGGADGSSAGLPGAAGSASTFSTITSAGGGFGSGGNVPSPTPNRYGGGDGGSGGGASYSPGVKGNGNTPSVSPPQGNNGGCASNSPYRGAAGGGGATAVGAENAGPGCTPNPNAYAGALGGAGATSSINGTPTARASGGSGGSYYPNGAAPGATPGGGGAGGPGSGGVGSAGTTNTGGGGGGGGSGNPGPGAVGSAGGSGIVIIRYKFQ
jgi:hypothetical protein